MNQITFTYNSIDTIIQYSPNETLNQVISRFIQVSGLDANRILFLYSGRIIEPNMTVQRITPSNNAILVIDKEENENNIIVNSSHIICPKCKTNSRIKIDKYKISLYGCDKMHNISDLLFDEFDESQKINISQIKCNACNNNNNKGNSYNHEFFTCFTCNKNLCQLCKSVHNQNHMINNYDLKNFFCKKHNDKYIKFCEDCNLNICLFCHLEHKGHRLVDFGNILGEESKIEQVKNRIDKIKNFINNQIKIYNKVKDNLNILENICEKINNYYLKYNNIMCYNYQTIKNLDEICKINLPDTINNDVIIDIYNQMNDSITIKYEGSNEPIRIFGENFLENNKQCEIIYKGKKMAIKEFILPEDNEIEIKLLGINSINNASYMFFDCSKLLGIQDAWRWNISKITDLSGMFCSCKLLKNLSDISNWNTTNVEDMSDLFHGCSDLTNIPDISKWDLSNTKNIGGMFYGCSNLTSLPDISKWNTKNIEDMSDLFYDCLSLTNIPDISKWNIEKVKNKMNMFKNCPNSLNIPSKFK